MTSPMARVIRCHLWVSQLQLPTLIRNHEASGYHPNEVPTWAKLNTGNNQWKISKSEATVRLTPVQSVLASLGLQFILTMRNRHIAHGVDRDVTCRVLSGEAGTSTSQLCCHQNLRLEACSLGHSKSSQ